MVQPNRHSYGKLGPKDSQIAKLIRSWVPVTPVVRLMEAAAKGGEVQNWEETPGNTWELCTFSLKILQELAVACWKTCVEKRRAFLYQDLFVWTYEYRWFAIARTLGNLSPANCDWSRHTIITIEFWRCKTCTTDNRIITRPILALLKGWTLLGADGEIFRSWPGLCLWTIGPPEDPPRLGCWGRIFSQVRFLRISKNMVLLLLKDVYIISNLQSSLQRCSFGIPNHFSVFDFCFSWWQSRMTSSSCWTNAIACSATGSSPESWTICNTINHQHISKKYKRWRVLALQDLPNLGLPANGKTQNGRKRADLKTVPWKQRIWPRILVQPWRAALLTALGLSYWSQGQWTDPGHAVLGLGSASCFGRGKQVPWNYFYTDDITRVYNTLLYNSKTNTVKHLLYWDYTCNIHKKNTYPVFLENVYFPTIMSAGNPSDPSLWRPMPWPMPCRMRRMPWQMPSSGCASQRSVYNVVSCGWCVLMCVHISVEYTTSWI